jgi:hypothetical protein
MIGERKEWRIAGIIIGREGLKHLEKNLLRDFVNHKSHMD